MGGPYGDGGSRKYLLSSLDQSLSRMGLDYVDIFYHHRYDQDTPLEESMLALDAIVRSGKALYVGISNYNREQTARAYEILRELKTPFIINQRRYSMLDRNIETDHLTDYVKEKGIGIIAFSPLAQGRLTERYLDGIPADSRIRTDGRFLKEKDITPTLIGQILALREIARGRGQSVAQLALSWILRDSAVTSVLIGASSPEQILDNVGIVNAPPFTPDELAAIERVLRGEG